MRLRQKIILGFVFLAIILFFFRPVLTKGYLPFPGDLLLAEYQPWRSSSFNGINPGAVPNKAQYFDALRQMYPWKTFITNEIKNFRLPLWNPFNFAGSPLLANFQSAAFYPLTIINFIFSGPVAWTILIILQPMLSMIFTFLFCRKIKLSVSASLLSSIAYSWCLFMTVFLEYNTVGHYLYLLPLIILCVEEYFENHSLWSEILLILAVMGAGYAGHIQLFTGLIVYVFAYSLIRAYLSDKNLKSVISKVLPVLGFIVLGIALTGIQLLPTIELISLSARSAHQYQYFISHFLITPAQLILFLVPDLFGNPATRSYLLDASYPSKALYIGLIPIFFALLGIFTENSQKFIKLFLFLGLGILIFTISNPIGNLFYGLNLPFISTSSPSNLLFLLSFSLCVLAGFGFEAFFKNKKSPWPATIGFFWLIIFGVFVLFKFNRIVISTNNLVYSAIVLFTLTAGLMIAKWLPRFRNYLTYALIIITVIDLAYFFGKFNSFVPASYFYPATPIGSWVQKHAGIDRVWGYGSAAISANFETQLGIYSPNGYDPLYPGRYGQFIQTSSEGVIPREFTENNRSDATVAPGYGENDLMNNPFRLKVLRTLGVRYILDKIENGSTQKTFPPEIFSRLAQINDWIVYEYKSAAPRVFLTSKYQIFNDNSQFTGKFFNPEFNPSEEILLENKPELVLNRNSPIGEVKIIKYLPNYIALETLNADNQLLFLSDTYYPGWQAYVDGKPKNILRADFAFRAVEVPGGTHRVEFKYQPKSFYFGLISTIISLVVILMLTISRKIKK